MSDEPLISIVLPTHNGAKYLGLSVESCLGQDYPHWELILVDDASTDDTPDLIRQYVAKDKRIRTLRHDKNLRLPGALNSGFQIAEGALFTWTSDDNLYRPQALSEMATYLRRHPDVSLVYAQATDIDAEGNPIGMYPVGPVDALVKRNCVGGCFLYRREVHEALNGYAEELFLAEDYDFWLRASIQFKLAYLPQDLYLYRRHAQSLTSSGADRAQLLADKTLEIYLNQLPWLTRAGRASAHVRLARGAFRFGHPSAGRRHLSRAARLSPLVTFIDSLGIATQSIRRRIHERPRKRAALQ